MDEFLVSSCTHSMAWAFCWTVGVSVCRLQIHTLILAAHLGKDKSDMSRTNFILFYTVDGVSKKWIQEVCYLSISTFSPHFHLAFVTGGVWEERCLACADADHLAIVWVFITAFTEELSTKNISAKEKQCLFLIMFGWYEEWRIKIRAGCRATVALYVLLGLTLSDRGWTDPLRGVCRSHSRLLWCCGYSILVWPP